MKGGLGETLKNKSQPKSILQPVTILERHILIDKHTTVKATQYSETEWWLNQHILKLVVDHLR